MESRPPYWCPKTIKRWPCWCPKPILLELKLFLMYLKNFLLFRDICIATGHMSEKLLLIVTYGSAPDGNFLTVLHGFIPLSPTPPSPLPPSPQQCFVRKRIACVGNVPVRSRSKEQGTRVNDRAKKGVRKSSKIPFLIVPRSLFALKLHGNACLGRTNFYPFFSKFNIFGGW